MPETVPTSSRPIWRLVILGVLLGGLVAALGDVFYTLVGSNLREVIPGELYRCAQPTAASLERARQLYGVRTVLALRGVCEWEPWYQNEIRGAEEQGMSLEVVGMSAGRLPSVPAVHRLCEIAEQTELPLMVHCQRGVDRTGLVCALYLLLKTEATLEQARAQLSFRYLHINAGRTAAMGRFFDLYADWLQKQQQAHTSERFRHWLLEVYRPPQGYARLELLAPVSPEGAVVLEHEKPSVIPVRVWNDTDEDLSLTAGKLGGMHLRWMLVDANRETVLPAQPGGLRDVRVPPGESADLNVYLPAVRKTGRYYLSVDLFNGYVGSFAVFGSDPLFVELDVR